MFMALNETVRGPYTVYSNRAFEKNYGLIADPLASAKSSSEDINEE
jgi:hypothetical protein